MRRRSLVLTGLVVLAACGCGPGAATTEDNTAGMGVPQQRAASEHTGNRRAMQARVHVAPNGCFLGSVPGASEHRRYLVVWPPGTEQGAHGDELRLPDGTAVRDRDLVAGRGVVLPTRRLEGFGSDGYWDFAVGFCTPGAARVLVLDSAAVTAQEDR